MPSALVPLYRGGSGKVCNRTSVLLFIKHKDRDSSMDLPLYHSQVPSRNELGGP